MPLSKFKYSIYSHFIAPAGNCPDVFAMHSICGIKTVKPQYIVVPWNHVFFCFFSILFQSKILHTLCKFGIGEFPGKHTIAQTKPESEMDGETLTDSNLTTASETTIIAWGCMMMHGDCHVYSSLKVQRVTPQYHFFGHIHEDGGKQLNLVLFWQEIMCRGSCRLVLVVQCNSNTWVAVW